MRIPKTTAVWGTSVRVDFSTRASTSTSTNTSTSTTTSIGSTKY